MALMIMMVVVLFSIWLVINNIMLRRQLKQRTEALKNTQVQLVDAHKKSAVAALSAGILHQLGQPITAIYGFTRLLKAEMRPNDALYKSVEMLDEQTTYVKEMLANLMALVKHHQIIKKPIDVNAAINKALHLLKDELRIQQVDCRVELANDMPLLMADSMHLQQIFMNLTVNAMEAMKDVSNERPRILMVKSSYDRANHQAVIIFKDNGPGIAQEYQSKIFDPFFTTKSTGTGLGLGLCRDLVLEHGGTIRVDSDGLGTAFTMVFSC